MIKITFSTPRLEAAWQELQYSNGESLLDAIFARAGLMAAITLDEATRQEVLLNGWYAGEPLMSVTFT